MPVTFANLVALFIQSLSIDVELKKGISMSLNIGVITTVFIGLISMVRAGLAEGSKSRARVSGVMVGTFRTSNP